MTHHVTHGVYTVPDRLEEGDAHPSRTRHVWDDTLTWKPLNPLYESCPLGMRITDLPKGWASNGRLTTLKGKGER